MNVKVDLHKLSKEQIISLIESGAMEHEGNVEQDVEEDVEEDTVEEPEEKKLGKFDTAAKLGLIRVELAKGKPLEVPDIEALGIKNVVYFIKRYLRPSRWARVEGGGRGHTFLIHPTQITARFPKQKAKPEHTVLKRARKRKYKKRKQKRRKTKFNLFMSVKMKQFMKDGMSNSEAFHAAIKAWKKEKRKA